MLGLPAAAVPYCILMLVAVVSAAAAWLSFRLDKAYTLVIQKNLAHNMAALEPHAMEDFSQSLILKPASGGHHLPLDTGLTDTQLQQLTELRSGDPRRVKEALREMGLLDPVLVPQVIRLLGSDTVHTAAHAALARTTFRNAGQLSDALLDESLEYAVRRRIPRLLAACGTRRAWDGLFEGLTDSRFELRFRCSRGLAAMLQRHPELRPEPAVVYSIIERELNTNQGPWGTAASGDDENSPNRDDGSEDTSTHGVAHVFALLGLVLPQKSVRTAFRALHTEDRRLRALALEYLGSSLPREIRDRLRERIEGAPAKASPPDLALKRSASAAAPIGGSVPETPAS
jgi:hypothetical protein